MTSLRRTTERVAALAAAAVVLSGCSGTSAFVDDTPSVTPGLPSTQEPVPGSEARDEPVGPVAAAVDLEDGLRSARGVDVPDGVVSLDGDEHGGWFALGWFPSSVDSRELSRSLAQAPGWSFGKLSRTSTGYQVRGTSQGAGTDGGEVVIDITDATGSGDGMVRWTVSYS